MEDLAALAMRAHKGAAGFANEMREKGIHVGWGSNPRCVVDGEPWPCSHERQAQERST